MSRDPKYRSASTLTSTMTVGVDSGNQRYTATLPVLASGMEVAAGTSVNAQLAGSVADGVTSTTLSAALTKAAAKGSFLTALTSRSQALGSWNRITIPPGDYVLSAADIDFLNSLHEVEIRGEGKQNVRLQVPSGKYLLNTTDFARSIVVTDMIVYGGKGLCRMGYSGVSVHAIHHFERLNLVGYSECAIGSLSSNQAYMVVLDCIFHGTTDMTSIGLVIPNQVGTSRIEGNQFNNDKYHIKKLCNDSFANIGPNNAFLSYGSGRVADIWLVPTQTAPSSAGIGCGIIYNRFSSENRAATDRFILVADEDTNTGSDFLSRNVHKTSDSASTKYVNGIRLIGCGFGAQATASDDPPSSSIVYSEIPRFGNFIAQGNTFSEGFMPYVVEFASGVTPDNQYQSRQNLIEIPTGYQGKLRSRACNKLGWATPVDPLGHHTWNGVDQAYPAAAQYADYLPLLLKPGPLVTTWGLYLNATKSTVGNDPFGKSGLVEVTYDGVDVRGAIGDTLNLSNIRPGEVAWFDFWLGPASQDTCDFVHVWLVEDNVETWRQVVTVPARLSRVRLMMRPATAATAASIRIGPAEFWRSGKSRIRIALPYAYHSPYPINHDHVGTLGGGTWDAAHMLIGTSHLWLDSAGRPKIHTAAPTADTDGKVIPVRAALTAKTADYTVTTSDAIGGRFSNVGATGTITFSLPSAAADYELEFYRSASQTVRVDPNGTQTIGSGGAGKYLSMDSDKAFIRIRCIVAGHWVVVESAGTITYEA